MSPSTCHFGPREPFVLSALALPGNGELGQDPSRALVVVGPLSMFTAGKRHYRVTTGLWQCSIYVRVACFQPVPSACPGWGISNWILQQILRLVYAAAYNMIFLIENKPAGAPGRKVFAWQAARQVLGRREPQLGLHMPHSKYLSPAHNRHRERTRGILVPELNHSQSVGHSNSFRGSARTLFLSVGKDGECKRGIYVLNSEKPLTMPFRGKVVPAAATKGISPGPTRTSPCGAGMNGWMEWMCVYLVGWEGGTVTSQATNWGIYYFATLCQHWLTRKAVPGRSGELGAGN